jgi:L-ribulose-5-phosphate 3-epimerase UlaE
MHDREKLIKEFEHLVNAAKGNYFDFVDLPVDEGEEILSLLKEQEAKWIEYPECLAYDGAYSDSHIVCSACKHVFDIMDNCTEEFDYCPHCGAKMK